MRMEVPDLPHLAVEDALLCAELCLPCADLLFCGGPIEKAVDSLHSRWESRERIGCGVWPLASVTR